LFPAFSCRRKCSFQIAAFNDILNNILFRFSFSHSARRLARAAGGLRVWSGGQGAREEANFPQGGHDSANSD
jgi:hypothetical protein